MKYFWITQNLKSQKLEMENGWLRSRQTITNKYRRESVKDISKGDLIFFCTKGIIKHIGFALGSAVKEIDEKGVLLKVKFKYFLLDRAIIISEHSKFLLEKRIAKHSPVTSKGIATRGYCTELNNIEAWYLLSRAGVYFSNGKIVELDKGMNNRLSNIHNVFGSLQRKDVIDVIHAFESLNYTDYKFQHSSTYDLEYKRKRFPPKVIFGFAAINLINRVLFADEFSGGIDSPCFSILGKLGFNIVEKNDKSDYYQDEPINSLVKDIEIIEGDNEISITERKQLIDARVGQGKFRKALKEIYGQCPLTGITLDEMLRASHIKPWHESTNKERLDPYNGLLLSANIDALFDKGLLSFKDNGELILSQKLKQHGLMELIGIDTAKQIKIKPQSIRYLEWHRNKYFPYL